jgi:hypothetical protein
MRKLLLASVATMGVTLAMSGGAQAQPVKPVAPGTIVIHMNGYFQFNLGVMGSSYNNIVTKSSSGAYTGTFKLSPVGTIGDFRIYPGFDAQTVDGLDYGVATDIRTSYSNAAVGQNGKTTLTSSSTSTTTAKTAGGKTTFTTTTTTTTTNTSQSGLYVKRAYGYIGTPDYGFVRFGTTDSAFTLLQSGVIEAFGDGGQWTLEGAQAILFPTNTVPAGGNQFIYADQTPVYGTQKVVYISPAFDGFSGIVGYEPNSDALKQGYNSCGSATSTCAALSSSGVAGDIGSRRKNTVDAGVQYLNTIDGYKIKTSADYLTGAPVSYTGVPPTTASALTHGYDNLSVYQVGAQVTFAGLTLGANLKGGQVEDGYTFKPKGGRDALAYIIGASYVIGPYVVGASYFNSQSSGAYFPGSKGIAHTLSEYGIAVGGNYVVSPNLSLFSQYLYGHRHQPGNASTSLITPAGNTQGQSIALGATLKW